MILRHLLQSTLFAVVAGLLTLAFRRNRANVRYSLWLVASVKFLIPFSVLVSAGSLLPWRMGAVRDSPVSIEYLQSRFGSGDGNADGGGSGGNTSVGGLESAHVPEWLPGVICVVWGIGFAGVSLSWWRRWRGLHAALRTASRVEVNAGIPAMASGLFPEPGVYGIRRPLLLLPAGITEQLLPEQLEAIVAHELCHVRRRDNLVTLIHMAVEAVYWFHPLVWWIGARLMEERERACDEDVLQMGSSPQVYAEGILKICELYLASPLPCVAGVTGANLKQRIEEIMANRNVFRLSFARKAVLAGAGMAALLLPIVIGMLNAPAMRAQAIDSSAGPKFEVASIKPCQSDVIPGIRIGGDSPGRLTMNCQPLLSLINQAYSLFRNGRLDPPGLFSPIEGGPAWIRTELYSIEAKPGGAASQGTMRGPMMRALLEDRFKLKIRRETREVPIYALTVAKGGAKLQASVAGSCAASDIDHPFVPPPPGQALLPICRMAGISRDQLDVHGGSLADLATALAGRRLGRPVVDRTGIEGAYDFHFDFGAGSGIALPPPPPPGPGADPATMAPPVDPADIFLAIQGALEKIGLKLESAKGPGEFLVIEHAERPSEN